MTEYKKGTPWLVLTPEMKQFEKKTGKKAVYNGKITGQFEYWLWQQEKKQEKKPKTGYKSKAIVKQKEYTREQIKRKLRNALKVFRTPKNSNILDAMIEETLDKVGFRILAEATISELRDSFRINNLKQLQEISKISKPTMEEILTEARKGPDEFLEWSKKNKIKLKVVEIEKDYRNLKQKSKAELWKIYGRSHKVYSEDKQMSKGVIISFILNDRYTRKELEQWDPPKQKPKKQLTQTPELYIVRRQSIPTTSKKDKQWKIYVKIGKEKVYIALENGSQRLVHLDGDKTMLRTHLKWRYSIDYNSDGIAKALNVKSIEHKYIKYDSGYFVSNITDVVVDKMNMLAKHTGSKSRFSMPIKRS